MKAFALFATALMVLVVFSQNVGIGEGAAGDGPEFEEESRRLTVAGGVSRAPQLALDASGALHVAWADARVGSFGPYAKSSRDGGLTFSGDRGLGKGFQSISSVGIATDPSSRTIAVAWSGAVGTDPPRVFVRASPDAGRTWATPGVVGPGSSASVAAASGEVLLAYVHGNGTPPSNTLSSNLNSRVIQLVIVKNLTLAQAWGILDLARTQNGTTNVTSFPFFATGEFYPLGFLAEVNSLSANTSVLNGGNYTPTPPPLPPTLWQLFWNTIAGWAERVWNAVVAVGAFFANVGKWLAQAFVSVVKGLTTGDWEDFQNQVLEPLAKALEALMEVVGDLIQALLRNVLDPLLNPLKEWVVSVAKAVRMAARALIQLVNSGFGQALTDFLAATSKASELIISIIEPLLFALQVLAVALAIAAGPVAFLLNFLIGIVSSQIISLVAGQLPNVGGFDLSGVLDGKGFTIGFLLLMDQVGTTAGYDYNSGSQVKSENPLAEFICAGFIILLVILGGLAQHARDDVRKHGAFHTITQKGQNWRQPRHIQEPSHAAKGLFWTGVSLVATIVAGLFTVLELSQKPEEIELRPAGAALALIVGVFGVLAGIKGYTYAESKPAGWLVAASTILGAVFASVSFADFLFRE